MRVRGALGVLAGLLVSGAAAAETKLLSLEPVTPAPPPGVKNPPWQPTGLRARVKCPLPFLKTGDFKLQQIDSDPPAEYPAKVAVSFKDTSEAMALVVMVQGNERFMGNSSLTEQDGTTPREPTVGAFEHVKQFLEPFGKVGPPNARGALIVYGERVTTKVAMGPLSAIDGNALGAEQDYWWVGSKQFKDALEHAFLELSKEQNARKVLVLLGDGEDINASIKLDGTIERLRGLGVEVYAAHYTPKRGESAAGVTRMRALGQLGDYVQAVKGDELADKARQLATDIDSLYIVDFDGTVLPADGRPHDYLVLPKNLRSDEKTIALPAPPPAPPPPPPSNPWPWIAGGLGVVALIGVVWIIRRRRAMAEPFAEAQPAPPQPGVAPVASAPGASPRTVMINPVGTDDDTPIVAWLVPMNGPHQWATFKMNPGRTVIGTAADCNVVISDVTMSTHHAEIVATLAGFVLHDKGSTNGVIVNARRVPSHELVDNDTITLGRTEFRFKSIV